jgi:hypothetical protein
MTSFQTAGNDQASAGDAIPANCKLIEVHVAQLKQLFNAIDPSPFHDRDLDPGAEAFIVGWSRELPRDAPLGLVVHLDRPAGLPDEASALSDAIHRFFRERGTATRQRLGQLLHRGRISLVIGIAFLAASIGASRLLANWTTGGGVVEILRQSLSIAGWVAMWRPMEVFLYDWWPIAADARLFDRLAGMPVRVRYAAGTGSDAWRGDWPASSSPPRGEL